MKLEVGMYVRTKYNGIGKLIEYINDPTHYFYKCYKLDRDCMNCEEYITEKDVIGEPSFNIIDLIKSGDIILGKDGKVYQCWKIYKDYVFTYSKNKQGQTITLVDYQIDKILTNEQFKQMSYKAGD